MDFLEETEVDERVLKEAGIGRALNDRDGAEEALARCDVDAEHR